VYILIKKTTRLPYLQVTFYSVTLYSLFLLPAELRMLLFLLREVSGISPCRVLQYFGTHKGGSSIVHIDSSNKLHIDGSSTVYMVAVIWYT
jgi:hypothetical protein